VGAKLDNGDVKVRTVEMKFVRGTTKCTWLNLKKREKKNNRIKNNS